MSNEFLVHHATREKAYLKIGVSGTSGSGKTYSSLLLAKGLASNWDKIILIDTENGSGDLYSDLGNYQVITFRPPFSPQRYIEVLKYADSLKPEVIILDSVTHEWDGEGGCLEMIDKLTAKNDYAKWGKITPLHNKFIQAILQIPIHIIATMRKKSDFTLSMDKNGKNIPQKVGLKNIQRDGFEFELTMELSLDDRHLALASKDRTNLFNTDIPFLIDEKLGEKIKNWNNNGAKIEPVLNTKSEPELAKDELPPLPTNLQARKDAILSKISNAELQKKYKLQLLDFNQARELKDWEHCADLLTEIENYMKRGESE